MKIVTNKTEEEIIKNFGYKLNENINNQIVGDKLFQLNLSIEPSSDFCIYIYANNEDDAVLKAKNVCKLRDDEITTSYEKSRFADCFGINEIGFDENKQVHYKDYCNIDILENEIIEIAKSECNWLITNHFFYIF